MKPTLVTMNDLVDIILISVCNILMRIFICNFVRETGLYFLVLVISLSGFGIRVITDFTEILKAFIPFLFWRIVWEVLVSSLVSWEVSSLKFQ